MKKPKRSAIPKAERAYEEHFKVCDHSYFCLTCSKLEKRLLEAVEKEGV